MHIFPTAQFRKAFKKLPPHIQKQAIVKDQIFRQEPFAPQLKTHKLKGKLVNFWSYSIKFSYRIVFEFVSKNKVIYHDIGTHEIYR